MPPPESFGNDDNRLNEILEPPVPVPQPAHPDVTGAAGSHQPDLIQDVAVKEGPGISFRESPKFNNSALQYQLHTYPS